MYATGTQMDFENRMHQLPSNAGDLGSFVTEGNNYLIGGTVDIFQSGKWETEARRQTALLNQNPSQILNQVFSIGLPDPPAVDITNVTVFDGGSIIIVNWDTSSMSSNEQALTYQIIDRYTNTILANNGGTLGEGDDSTMTWTCPVSYKLSLVTIGDGVNYNAINVTGNSYAAGC